MDSERQIRHLKALLEISKAMAGEIPFDSLLQVIMRKTVEVMEADRCSLFLYDESTNELWSKIAQGLKETTELRFPVGLGIAGEVARNHKGANIPNAYADIRFNPEFDEQTGYRTRSLLCFPILTTEGKLIGVIQVLNKKANSGEFDTDDELLLAALATHVAIAIERAQLIESLVEKQRIVEALKLAHDIQMSMVPQIFPPFPGKPELDLFATMIPAKEVGGDFYDFCLLDSHHLFFVIGDVSGKGVPAALFMAVTKTLIKASAKKGISPDKILREVNAELCVNNDSCTFVTVFCGILNTNTGEILYADAGHNPPLLLQRGTQIHELKKSGGMAIGVLEDAPFTTHSFRLEAGDSLFLYTDGVTEALNSKAEFFSETRLKKELIPFQGNTSHEIVMGIVHLLTKFSKGLSQADDITILNIRLKARGLG